MSDTEEEAAKVKRIPFGTGSERVPNFQKCDRDGDSYSDPDLYQHDIGSATNDLDLDQVNDNLQDDDDNLSLEVNFGDGSSCRASDVSSLSFQNIVLDDPDTVDSETVELVAGSRRDSDESGDSIPTDFMLDSDAQTFSGALEDEIRRKASYHERAQISDEEDNDDSYNTGTMKRKSKLSVASTGSGQREEDGDTCTGSGSTQCNDQNNCDGSGNCGTPNSEAKSLSEAIASPNGSGGSDSIHDVIPAALAAVMARGSVPPPISSYSPDERMSGSASSSVSVDGDNPVMTSVGMSMPSAMAGIEAQLSMAASGTINGTSSLNNANLALSSSSGSGSPDPNTQLVQNIQIKKRNSAEIRNNIPNVNEVKNYEGDTGLDVSRYQGQGAVPKMRKKSPGLARRLDGAPSDRPSSDRDTSSSEKEPDPSVPIDTSVISAQRRFETQLRNGGTSALATLQMSKPTLPSIPMSGDTDSDTVPELAENHKSQDPNRKNMDIENEYDYVKYARIQKGDSYVGMRLAYSSSNDSLNYKNRMPGGVQNSEDDHYLGSSREMSPEKSVQSSHNNFNDHLRTKVNEDSLTEIPLNGSDQLQTEEKKDFSLSPEATECDSAEVESVISEEEGKSSASGMPMVEDGLSSSQGSDTEDASTMDNHRPAEILKRRFKSEIEQELNNLANEHHHKEFDEGEPIGQARSSGTSSRQSEVSSTDVERQREAVDMAIQDIKSAIEKSKSTMLKSPQQENAGSEEPVWVMRDNYVRKLQRQEEMRRVREEIERQQEEENIRKEQEQVYQLDKDDESLLKGQYTRNETGKPSKEYDTDEETDELLDKQYNRNEQIDIPELSKPPVNRSAQAEKRRSRAKQGERESLTVRDNDGNAVLIEGVLFRARYLGSTQLISEGAPSKAMRMMQAQEAVGRIKAPAGESQPSTEVDLFVSQEKIMVLNTNLQEIMMDHALRTISYIADIGDIVVIMARRRTLCSPGDEVLRRKKQSKILCHVFESEEASLIAQSIGQAFQVAYMEFLKANGIDDPGLMKEMDYQEVLNQQEIFGEELFLFSNKDMQKEVITPKLKGEPLGVVVVESGWGSMVPTVVLANMSPSGAAARCGQLNIGDQIMSINGISLVGLPLSTCQNYIKAAKNQTVVKLTVVSCPPVVEVLIKRPDVKYQLGFSVQNGVICSLLRGGIAERGGVRVGHRIIEINGQSVVAVPHEKIVNMLATSVGEIHMKTMPTSIFRLLTGQETPHYI